MGFNFCPTCGAELQFKEAEICPTCGVRIKEPPLPESEKYAGVWDRFAAYLVDFIVGILIVCAISLIGIILLPQGFLLPCVFISFGLYWLYFAYYESSPHQATFGKRFLKIQVTDEHGQPIPFMRSLGRSFFKILTTITPFSLLALVNGLVIHFSQEKKGIHDYIFNTRVVKSSPVSSARSILVIIAFFAIVVIVTIVIAAVIAAFVFGMAGSVEKTKNVAAIARQSGDNILVTWYGGPDNSLVTGYTVYLKDDPVPYPQKNGQGQRYPPDIGEYITLPGGTSGMDHVVVAAEFSDGSSQVVLDTYV